ncbi:FkbM family methyltransferase [Nitrobacter winogradskyi]|uniref:FkbM family methyltransferase n=2 Tax=Nitrobacter winogradskyi TaxID=913 RepID=A0ACC6AFN2_NITWI|nr:FkbM family methyltransferase [Nitrobacter winogradskyi]MCP1998027.1 FkbM family methyltransferase [Nitrobacter winogradskyi]GEC16043.1 methyltransferase [Nitrobacter winogradskyi]
MFARPFGSLAPNWAQKKLLHAVRRSRLRRGAFRPAMSRLLDLLRPGPIDDTYQGASFRFYHQYSGTERGALLNPDYNLEELQFLRKHTTVGGCFVDIGANVGTYALAMAQHVGAGGVVLAIEPHPVAYERLAFNREASGSRNVHLMQAAAGESDGDLLIATDGNNLGASHVVSAGASRDAITVRSVQLRQALERAGIRHVHALKIDVEGYEDRVLVGFFQDAPRSIWPQAIVIEHLSRSEWSTDCIALMLECGYVVAGTTRSNTMLTL